MNDQAKKRLYAILLCACFIIGSLLATIYIIEHSHHDCTGHDCPVCAQIHSAENLLKQLGRAAAFLALAFACLSAAYNALGFMIQTISPITPITQKIRMNN